MIKIQISIKCRQIRLILGYSFSNDFATVEVLLSNNETDKYGDTLVTLMVIVQ